MVELLQSALRVLSQKGQSGHRLLGHGLSVAEETIKVRFVANGTVNLREGVIAHRLRSDSRIESAQNGRVVGGVATCFSPCKVLRATLPPLKAFSLDGILNISASAVTGGQVRML